MEIATGPLRARVSSTFLLEGVGGGCWVYLDAHFKSVGVHVRHLSLCERFKKPTA